MHGHRKIIMLPPTNFSGKHASQLIYIVWFNTDRTGSQTFRSKAKKLWQGTCTNDRRSSVQTGVRMRHGLYVQFWIPHTNENCDGALGDIMDLETNLDASCISVHSNGSATSSKPDLQGPCKAAEWTRQRQASNDCRRL